MDFPQTFVWIQNTLARMGTISYVSDHGKEVFDREGIEPPFPIRDIRITFGAGEKPVEVDVKANKSQDRKTHQNHSHA